MTTHTIANYFRGTGSERRGRRIWIGGNLPNGELWVYSAPAKSVGQIDKVLAQFGMSGSWSGQPLEVASNQLRINFSGQAFDPADLVVELARLNAVFELSIDSEFPERYLHHPALGICRNQLDQAGEIVLRAGQLEALLLETGGNVSEFARGFRRLTAVPWLDLMEPYRKVAEYAIALPRAV